MTPYVQNVTKWISHYNPDKASDVHVSPHTDSHFGVEGVGLAQEGRMGVAQVESKGPAPPVPSLGTPAALRTVATSQAAVQQAAFDAKREEIEKSEATAGSRKKTNSTQMKKGKKGGQTATKSNGNKKGGVVKGTGKTKIKNTFFGKSSLLGTPGDIFKSRTSKKKK